jgi:hypothetical protein
MSSVRQDIRLENAVGEMGWVVLNIECDGLRGCPLETACWPGLSSRRWCGSLLSEFGAVGRVIQIAHRIHFVSQRPFLRVQLPIS